MAQITLKGDPVHTIGELPKVGDKAPDFLLTKTDLSDISLKDVSGKKVILNISLFCVAVLVAIVFLEAVTRIFKLSHLWESIKQGHYKDNIARFNDPDRVLGWRPRPELDLKFQKWQGEFSTHIQTNSKGLRSQDIPYRRLKNKKRIMFLGDSFAWGFGVSNNEMFSNILADRFKDRLEVVNLGVSGYGLSQEYLMYKGEDGLKQTALTCIKRAAYFAERLKETAHFRKKFAGSSFNEFVMASDRDVKHVLKSLKKEKILGGIRLGSYYLELKDSILVSFTEMNTREEIDRYIDILKGL